MTEVVGKGNFVGTALRSSGIPLNISFSEPSTKHNLEDQIDNRKFLAEICFEQLNCESISFLKQSSIHLYSNMKYNGIVVDLGANYTQICPVSEGYTSCLSSSFFKVTG
jgi:actin-related protein